MWPSSAKGCLGACPPPNGPGVVAGNVDSMSIILALKSGQSDIPFVVYM